MAKDLFHHAVRRALESDGWIITADPYKVKILGVQYDVDLGAEKLLAAERMNEKIAVEIKSFVGASFIYEFHEALGQYLNYEIGIEVKEPDRLLILAVPENVYTTYFGIEAIRIAVDKFDIKILVFNPITETVSKWIK